MDSFLDSKFHGLRWTGLLQKRDDGFVAAAHQQPVVCNMHGTHGDEQMMMVYDAKVSYGVHACLEVDDHARVHGSHSS